MALGLPPVWLAEPDPSVFFGSIVVGGACLRGDRSSVRRFCTLRRSADRSASGPACLHLVERLAGFVEHGVLAREALPAPYGDVDVGRVVLNAVDPAPDLLAGHDRGARAHEGVEHETLARRAVAHGVGDHRNRLHGRVHGKLVHAAGLERVRARITPNIRARAAVLTELEGIEMRFAPLLEHEHELVLRAVEGALAGVRLDPNADVLELRVDGSARRNELGYVAPVHADVADR